MELGPLLNGLLMLLIASIAVGGLLVFIVGLTRKKKVNAFTISGASGACLFGLLYFSLDRTGPSKITDEIEGTYSFTYPTGQMEILAIKNDNAFTQRIYSSKSKYLGNDSALFTNRGTWKAVDDELEFDHWLEYCEFRDPEKIVTVPYPTSMLDVSWYAATAEHSDLIVLFAENGYVFEKIAK